MIVSRTRFETTQHDSLIHMMLFGLDYLVVQRTTTTTTFYCCMDLLIASFGSGNEFFFGNLIWVFFIFGASCAYLPSYAPPQQTLCLKVVELR